MTEDFVWLALDQLKKENLLTNKDFDLRRMTGLSRREVVKRVGLATVIALPLISSLFVPPAAAAASPTGPCVTFFNVCDPPNGQICFPRLNCVFLSGPNSFRCVGV